MKKRREPESRLWNLLLLIHIILFGGCWALALHYLSTLNASGDAFHTYTMGIFVALAWTPLLLLHVGIHYYLAGRRSADERAVYREGFADAMRQLADRSYDEWLMLDDEGELVEMPVRRSAAKQKRG